MDLNTLRPSRRDLASLASLVLAMVLAGCAEGAAPSGPDMEPVGNGLRFIGIGLVVMALVFVLGASRD